jgi:hypothetical protein
MLDYYEKIFVKSSVIIPWGFVISILLFYLHVGLLEGELPTYARPDPRDTSLYIFYLPLIYPLLLLLILTLIPYLITFLILLTNGQVKMFWKPIVLALLGNLAAYLILKSPIFVWFID